jgi:hypothetical protein
VDPVANVPRTTPPAPAVLENAQRQPAGPHAAAAFAPVSTPYGVVAGVGRRGGVLARRSEESWALSTDYAAVQTQRSVARASWLLSPQTSALPPTVSVPELPGGRQEERVACCVTRCSIRRETLTVSPGYPATLQKPCAVDPHACLWRIGWVRRG